MTRSGPGLGVCAAVAMLALAAAWRLARSDGLVEAASPREVAATPAQDRAPDEPLVLSSLPEREAAPTRVAGIAATELPRLHPRARVVLRGTLRNSLDRAGEIDLRVRREWSRDIEALSETALPTWSGALDDTQSLPPELRGRVKSTVLLGGTRTLRGVDYADGEDSPAQSIRVQAGDDGSVEADITALFEGVIEVPDSIWLEIKHPNFDPAQHAISAAVGGRRITRAMLTHEGEFVLNFDVTLVPRCVVRGSAWASDGEARSIQIEAWELQNGRPAGMKARAVVESSHDIYEFSLTPDRRYAIVAFADELSPATAVVFASGALDLWMSPFVLEAGVAIAGRIDLGQHVFGNDVWLSLAPDYPIDPHLRFGSSGLVWTGVSAQTEARNAHAGDDGSFAFEGLAPGRYRLRIGIERDWWTEMDPVFVVYAPSTDLVLVPQLTRVTLLVEQGRRAFAHRDLRLRGAGRNGKHVSPMLKTDGFGQAAVWLLPGEPYIVDVPMGKNDWSYGKVTSWYRSEIVERIDMSAIDE